MKVVGGIKMNDLLKIYKDYIKVFNYTRVSEVKDFGDMVDVFQKLTDILEKNNVIRKHDLKHYEVIKTGEII